MTREKPKSSNHLIICYLTLTLIKSRPLKYVEKSLFLNSIIDIRIRVKNREKICKTY